MPAKHVAFVQKEDTKEKIATATKHALLVQ
jgi:hypothetical protein